MEGFDEALEAGRAGEVEDEQVEALLFAERPAVVAFQHSEDDSRMEMYVRKDLFDRVVLGDMSAAEEVERGAAGV